MSTDYLRGLSFAHRNLLESWWNLPLELGQIVAEYVGKDNNIFPIPPPNGDVRGYHIIHGQIKNIMHVITLGSDLILVCRKDPDTEPRTVVNQMLYITGDIYEFWHVRGKTYTLVVSTECAIWSNCYVSTYDNGTIVKYRFDLRIGEHFDIKDYVYNETEEALPNPKWDIARRGEYYSQISARMRCHCNPDFELRMCHFSTDFCLIGDRQTDDFFPAEPEGQSVIIYNDNPLPFSTELTYHRNKWVCQQDVTAWMSGNMMYVLIITMRKARLCVFASAKCHSVRNASSGRESWSTVEQIMTSDTHNPALTQDLDYIPPEVGSDRYNSHYHVRVGDATISIWRDKKLVHVFCLEYKFRSDCYY